MKRLVIGILAHVDAGKTTLSEALLCSAGELRVPGRVDHQNAFLDTHPLERSRGITIFSKPAVLHLPAAQITLLDTPGHMDFSTEAERAIRVLDGAVLVISKTDGIQPHTETLWQLLQRYRIPTFLFVNKTDLPGQDNLDLLAEFGRRFGAGCIDFSSFPLSCAQLEELSLCSEELMSEYLSGGSLSDPSVAKAVGLRQIFPCYFGSALQLKGIGALLDGIARFLPQPSALDTFGASIYKITQDEQGVRQSWMKITGGSLSVREQISGMNAQGEPFCEKVSGIRIFSGAKATAVQTVFPGDICTVTGLFSTFAGQGLGAKSNCQSPLLEPMMRCAVILPQGANAHNALQCFRLLEQEDPALKVSWNEAGGEIGVELMGAVQLEILQSVLSERFGLAVRFGPGRVLYKETIVKAVEGVGHYEPLRHFAEVHLVLSPLAPGSGLRFRADCREDTLDKNWQRLILSHLSETQHPGVLTGSPITDMEITLIAGKAHLKHTEGGDFRQATYRALRQGLRSTESLLLEPYYSFKLTVPADCVGRAMNDLQRLSCVFEAPEATESGQLLCGKGPAVLLQEYASELAGYTKGTGRIFCVPAGYEPCHNAAEAIAACGYDADADAEHPADSVFCTHGSGTVVKWYEAAPKMQIQTGWGKPQNSDSSPSFTAAKSAGQSAFVLDKELLAIFERTYGPVRRSPKAALNRLPDPVQPLPCQPMPACKEYLLVDGYNVIFADADLKKLAAESLEAARSRLCDMLCNYQGYRGVEVIAVFDAYKVKGNPGAIEKRHNIHVVYTKEAETADMYIEKATKELGRQYRVRVATSDGMEQLIILGHGALRLPASLFWEEMRATEQAIAQLLNNLPQ